MNYFAHGRNYIQEPYFMAGTAVPDWLSAMDRKVRTRSKKAKNFVNHHDERIAAIAQGILRHHYDDDWFHRTRAFAELSWQFTAKIRDLLPQDDGFRPSFLGHILVELLLDDVLIQQDPKQLDAYYEAMDQLDPSLISHAINMIANRPTDRVEIFVPLFNQERFLYDYAHDLPLLKRLNRVMQRVGLPELPISLVDFFGFARKKVSSRTSELLTEH